MCTCVYMRMAYETSTHHPNLWTISGLHSLLSTEAVSRRDVLVCHAELSVGQRRSSLELSMGIYRVFFFFLDPP